MSTTAPPVARAARDTPRDLARFLAALHTHSLGETGYVLLLGMRPPESLRLLRMVRTGLTFSALERFQEGLRFSPEQVARLLQIPARTLARRRQAGRLRPEESDRLLRVARVIARALELFNGKWSAARHWLETPQPTLGGVAPLELAETEFGAHQVESALGRIEHGVFA